MSKRRKAQHGSPFKAAQRLIRAHTSLADARYRLRAQGYAYDSYGEFLREHGEWHRPTRVMPWAPAACFGNAMVFAAVLGWTYVEGFAVARLTGGVHGHAWVLDDDGEPVEVTWLSPGVAYLGVPFHVARADDAVWNGDGCVLDDPVRRWPLLREPWTGEDWARDAASPRLRMMRVTALTPSGRQQFLDRGAPDPWPRLVRSAAPAEESA